MTASTAPFCLFLTIRGGAWHEAELATLLAATPGCATALWHRPAQAHDPYLQDGAPPDLVAQLHFADIASLEAATAPSGHLQALPPLLAGATATHQAMLARPFPVPNPGPRSAPHCTYLVAYDGPAEDTNAWLGHYIAHHPPIMARFPAIRAIEIYTRIDWISGLPLARENCMQRNKVVFDSPKALTEALNSPVRHEMREDFHQLPPFSGAVSHFPMLTHTLPLGEP